MIEKRKYVIAGLNPMNAGPDMIISGSLDDEIAQRMTEVIRTEAPIRESLLFKRVINSLSMKKVGSRIEPVFKRISTSLPFERTEEDGEAVFHCGDESFFRTSDDAERYSYQIPFDEAVNCLLYILSREQRIVTKSELLRLFLSELGYEKTGTQIEKLFRNASRSPRLARTGNGRFKASE